MFLGCPDGVKGYRLCDPTARKVIISRDVIFAEDKLQKEDINDNTERKNPETTTIHVKNKSQQQDSSEEELKHENQELTESGDPPVETESPEIRRLSRLTRRPGWHSNYIMESNVAYCLLIEDGELSTFQEALKNSDASLWMTTMQEEIETLHKNKTWDLVLLPQGRKAIGNK
ncbi:hypothetical protein LIER_21691 [Lithospermum erythrorhizon]|uniref:Retroviral polymerase SH3-like domain-containing protein n=1 Tax=Lithospermum erythrorhizon TaxID=34254 RepID=A0AAV3QUK9_LITER